MSIDSGQLEECSRRSLELLRQNATPWGMLAASRSERAERMGYDRVFGRDAGVCAIAVAYCADPRLIRAAKRSLETLAAHQAANGQIPKYVDVAQGKADFWYLGCIDATLWWLIALKLVCRATGDLRLEKKLHGQAEAALAWLACQEHQQIRLLQQNEASDWADIMPRSGFVLYTNALWYYVKRLYALAHAAQTRRHFNDLFLPFSHQVPEYRRLRLLTHYARNKTRNRELYLSFVNLGFCGDEGDVFGNLLAILFGLADEHRANRIVRAIARAKADQPYPVRVTLSTIGRDDPLWRAYMGRRQQNLEHRYHNGGIWPFVGGFWVLALAANGNSAEARSALARIAQANAVNGWEFNEWFHGASGAASGMPGQSWNAAMFLLACHGLTRRVF